MHSVEGSLTAQEWQCLNSPVAIADNFVYLTRISLGHDRAEKATDRKLTLNTAVRFFFFFNHYTNTAQDLFKNEEFVSLTW